MRARILIRLLAEPAVLVFPLSEPVVTVGGGIDIAGRIVVVIDRKSDVESPCQEIPFPEFQGGHERIALTVFLSEDDFLDDPVLYLLVHMRVGEAKYQAVGPFPVHQPRFGDHGFIVVGVVEPSDALDQRGVEAGASVLEEVFDGGVHIVAIVRIVLECVDLEHYAPTRGLAEVDLRFVRVEGTVGIGSVEKPSSAVFVGHDIDGSAQSVGPETDGNHAFVNFDPFCEVYRNIVQPE